MTLGPREQRTLLRMERSLRRDPALTAALHTFNCGCGCGCGGEPGQEAMSPWRPVLWRAELLALIALTLAFVGSIAALACEAL